MNVSTTDIKNRLGAGRFYQLLSESSLDEWQDNESYSIDDRITRYSDKYSASFKSLTNSNLDNDPSTDFVNWVLDSLPAQQCLNSAYLFVEGFIINRSKDFDDTNKFQAESIIQYCIGEIIDYGNPVQEEGAPRLGDPYRTVAENSLDNVFKLNEEDRPKQAPHLFVSKSNIESYRSLSDQDPQDQFRQDYESRDIRVEAGYK